MISSHEKEKNDKNRPKPSFNFYSNKTTESFSKHNRNNYAIVRLT